MLCKHEVVGSIPIGSTTSEIGSRKSEFGIAALASRLASTESSASPRGTRAARIFDIVKAGLAGLHDRLILYDTKTDRIISIIG